MTKLPMAERPGLTLEDYVLFFTSRGGHGLTIDHLNQIIFMHGFIRLHRHKKPVLVDALNSFDVMRPRRSTVGPTLAPPPHDAAAAAAAALSVDDVKRDIEELGWRECPIGSLLSVGTGGAAASAVPLATIPAECISPPSRLSASSPVAAGAVATVKRKGKGKEKEKEEKKAKRKKKKHVEALLTLSSIEMAASPN